VERGVESVVAGNDAVYGDVGGGVVVFDGGMSLPTPMTVKLTSLTMMVSPIMGRPGKSSDADLEAMKATRRDSRTS
jgi:hypothetical protein